MRLTTQYVLVRLQAARIFRGERYTTFGLFAILRGNHKNNAYKMNNDEGTGEDSFSKKNKMATVCVYVN